MHVKIDNFDLIRDTNSMAIINVDKKEKEEYLFNLNMLRNHKKDYDSLNEKVETLNSEIAEIKNILLKLVEK